MKGVHINSKAMQQITPDNSLSDMTSDDENEEFNDNKTYNTSLHYTFLDSNSISTFPETLPNNNPHKSITSIVNHNQILHELLHSNTSYFNIINARKIYERFICIGIDNTFLSDIEDIEYLDLNPRITFNFPNNESEQHLESNIIFLKNSCFKKAVKVKRFFVDNDEDFYTKIFERNFFAKFKNTLCLLQPISPEDEKKYFIYGVQFDDLYIMNVKNSMKKNIFVYDKTYLFISTDPLCKLYEAIMMFILAYKKLNFYQKLEEGFETLGDSDTMQLFESKNDEKSCETILEILQFFISRSFPKHEEYISFQSNYSTITMNYKHFTKSNEPFMALDYLCPILFKFISAELLYGILIRILNEQNFLFIADNIQQLTSFVLACYYLILPFTWPFTIIPNLPLYLSEIVESPVPYIIGILGDNKTANEFKNNKNIKANILILNKEKITIIESQPLDFKQTNSLFSNLKKIINTTLSKYQYILSQKQYNQYESSCELVYKNIHAILQRDIGEVIDNIIQKKSIKEFYAKMVKKKSKESNSSQMNGNYRINTEYYEYIQQQFVKSFKEKDKDFANCFSQTQIFAGYIDRILLENKKHQRSNSE